MSDNPCSQDKVNFYKQCKLSPSAQKRLDRENNVVKPWLKIGLSVAGGIAGAFLGPEGAMMGAMAGGALAGGVNKSLTVVSQEREVCGQAADLCETNQAIQDTLDQLDKEKKWNDDTIKKFTNDINDHLQSYYNSSQAIRTYYADKQKAVALMGWRVAIIIFFIVLFDILNIWPISKIWNPTNYGNLATKTNVKSMFAAFKKNIK